MGRMSLAARDLRLLTSDLSSRRHLSSSTQEGPSRHAAVRALSWIGEAGLPPGPVGRDPDAMMIAPAAMTGNPVAMAVMMTGGDDDRCRFRGGRRNAADNHEASKKECEGMFHR